MANFPGVIMSRGRLRTPVTDGGMPTKRERLGVERGQNVIPHNVNMRGLNQRVDRSKLP